MQYFAFGIILLIATNLKYCLWLVKYTLDCISKIKIRVKSVRFRVNYS